MPYCARTLRIPGAKYLPSHNRGIPVRRKATTIGGRLRGHRLQLRIFPAEATRNIEAYPAEVEVNAGYGDTLIVMVVNKTPKRFSG